MQSLVTFATMMVTCTTPWMVVMMLGSCTRRGWYDPDALQVPNRRQRDGRYRLAPGRDRRGTTASWVAAVIGVLVTTVPGQFTGQLVLVVEGS